MKRSSRITLHIVPTIAAAAMAAGCGSSGGQQANGWQTCVDSQNRVAQEQRCYDQNTQSRGGGAYPFYRWYYYPYGGSPYPYGYYVPRGGTYMNQPYAGVRSFSGVVTSGAPAPRSGVSYGGFGSTAHASAGE